MASEFARYTVKELQFYLKQRGVSVSNLKKQELINKCVNAKALNIVTDPDGLLENGHENTRKKLLTNENRFHLNYQRHVNRTMLI